MNHSSFELTGDVGSIRSSADHWSLFAVATSAAADDIRSIDSGGFEGDEADLYHQRLNGDLPPHLDTASDAWGAVSTALKTYASALEALQSRMSTLTAQAHDQQSQVDAANIQVADAHTADARHVASVDAEQKALKPGGLTAVDTYQPQTTGAASRLEAANGQLQSTTDAANRVHQEHSAAADTCVNAINQAAGLRFEEPPGFWGRLKGSVVGWIKDHADVLLAISSVLKQISSIAGLLAMIPILAPIMGPIAAVSGGAALVIDTTVHAATGKGSLTDILIDGAGMLPFGRALTALKGAKAGENAARAGDNAWAGENAARAGENAGRAGENAARAAEGDVGEATTATVGTRHASSDARAVASDGKAGGRASEGPGNATNSKTPVDLHKCAGDPIDVVTGEMIMSQTDLTLPGVLPLVLRRVHISSYRWGSLFGPTWASTLDQRVEIGSDGGVCFVAEDGVVLYFPDAAQTRPGAAFLPTAGIQRWPLRQAADGGWTIENPDEGVSRRFARPDGHGRCAVQEIFDRAGNAIHFEYDSDGIVCGLRHSGGYRVDINTEASHVGSISVRNLGMSTVVAAFGYDLAGNLVRVGNSSRGALVFECDDHGRIVKWSDRNGLWYRYDYDENGRCVRTSGRGRVLSYGFSYLPGRTLVTDSLGAIATYEYNEARQVTREIDPLGNVTATTWDRYDRLLLRTDALGRCTQLKYDASGRLIEVIHPDGQSESGQRNRLGLIETTTDVTGARWSRTFDDTGALLSVIDPLGHLTRYTRARSGALSSVTDPLGGRTTVSTDGAGLPVRVIDALGGETAFTYDGFGRLTLAIDPLNNVTTFSWTTEGWLSGRINPDGAREEWAWDGEGNLTAHTDAAGHTTEITNGVFDLPIARITPDGSRMLFGYDTELRLISVQNPAGLRWRYEYDRAGRLVRETDFNGREQGYEYDALGRLTAVVNGVGQRTGLAYDLAGDLVERSGGDGMTRFGYDGAGRMISAESMDAVVHLDRDGLGRVLRETVNGRTLSSTFDALGRRTSRVTPSGVSSEWTYDAVGRPATLATAGQSVDFQFDAAARETGRFFSAGGRVDQTFDVAGRLIAQVMRGAYPSSDVPTAAASSMTTARSFDYRIDGALTRITDLRAGTARRFDLDSSGRVLGVRAVDWSESYAYDRSGNVALSDSHGGSEKVDGRGRREYSGTLITRAGDVTYRHDGQGRVVTRSRKVLSSKPETWHYSYDTSDRMVQALTSGRRWTYSYDSLGRRISKQRLDRDGRIVDQTLFSWDGNRLIEQSRFSESAGRPLVSTWEYLPGSWRPITQTVGPAADDLEFYAVISDLVGTPTELVTADGARVAWTNGDRTLWGAPAGRGEAAAKNTGGLSKYSVDCPLRFPGQYADDETGLHYNRHRYYDPASARYTTADPLGLAPAPDPHSYVANPTGWADPLGLGPCRDVGQNAIETVNLATPDRTRHVLDGEVRSNGSYGGGHRGGTSYPGKSEFPRTWSDEQIMHHISDVATDPMSLSRPSGRGSTFVTATRDRIDIEVLIRNGQIWTGYPTNVLRNQ